MFVMVDIKFTMEEKKLKLSGTVAVKRLMVAIFGGIL